MIGLCRVGVLSARAAIGYDRVALGKSRVQASYRARSGTIGNRDDRVDLIGSFTHPVSVPGAPQESVLGPVLFLIFINDLLDSIMTSVRLLADDCVLYRNIKSLTKIARFYRMT